MRLEVLDHGHRLPAKAFQRLSALVSRAEMDDFIKTVMHRPAFFGRSFAELVPDVLRGPSYWTPAEREYMGAFTSRVNACPFCARAHGEVARLESDGAVDIAGDDTVRPELAAVLVLLEKVSQAPDDVSATDVDAVRVAGVPDDAIADAVHVNLIFNTVNRLANAFDWAWDSDDQFRAGTGAIHRHSYKLPGFVLR